MFVRKPTAVRYGLILCLGCLATPGASFGQQNAPLKELTKKIDELIKSFTRPRRPAQPQQMADPVNPNFQDRERKRSEERLNAYSATLQTWLAATCSLTDEQRAAVKERAAELVASGVNSEKPANRRATNQLGETFPLIFTQAKQAQTGLAITSVQTPLESFLHRGAVEAEQQAALKRALDERTDFHSQAFRDFVVAIVDKELYLTDAQRKELSAAWSKDQRRLEHPFYSFQAQSYYFPYQSISTLFTPVIRKTFDPRQDARLTDLLGANRNQHLVFQSNDGPDHWHKQLDDAGREQRDAFLRAVAVRVAYYESELDLPADKSRRLQTAGKGAAVLAVDEWKDTARNTIVQMEQQMAMMRGGNFAFGTQVLSVDALDSNQIWQTTLESVVPSDTSKVERWNNIRQSFAQSLVALLDRELWLLPEQREQLQPLVLKSLPTKTDPTVNQEYIRDVILLAYPLFRCRENELNKVLNAEQLAVWEKLKSYYQQPQGNSYIQIQLQNNGGSFAFSLSD